MESLTNLPFALQELIAKGLVLDTSGLPEIPVMSSLANSDVFSPLLAFFYGLNSNGVKATFDFANYPIPPFFNKLLSLGIETIDAEFILAILMSSSGYKPLLPFSRP